MWIDVTIVGVVLSFALLGLASGFWGQFLRILALASLYFVAPPVARQIRNPLDEHIDVQLSSTAMDGVALIVASIALYLLMSLTILIFLAVVQRGRKSAPNKLGGLVLGTTKGVALSYLLLCGLLLVASSDFEDELDYELIDQAQESYLVDVVEEHNFLEMMGYEIPSKAEIEALVEEHLVLPEESQEDAAGQQDEASVDPEAPADDSPPLAESPDPPISPPPPK